MSGIDESILAEAVSSDTTNTKGTSQSNWWKGFVVFAGICLPIAAILVELATGICSYVLNAIPTGWHLVLLVTVPVSNVAALWVYAKRDCRFAALPTFLIGVSIGVAAVYSLWFLPLMPIWLLAIISFGMGLLGLSPFLALASSILCSRRLGELRLLERRKHRALLGSGVAAALAVLGGFIFAEQVTIYGLPMAVSSDEATSLRGVKLIRTFGSKSMLLRACYELPLGFWPGVFWTSGGENRVTREQARAVYYRVTGASFNSVPPPKMFGRRSWVVEDFEFDSDVGGTAVNSIARNLSMSSSRIDTVVDSDALTAYSEWTMIFRNSASMEREARAEIALPPGGVVSRLTLWVNGEEREAAFAGRGKVRQAYRQVAVVYRRDPVLVTTCGPDRVLMQCFPVSPNGGTMKVRIGITSPLIPEGCSKGALLLPRFIERNFRIPDGVGHSVFIESSRTIAFDGGRHLREAGEEAGVVREVRSDRELLAAKNVLLCSRNPTVRSVWTPDILEPKRYAVVQEFVSPPAAPPKNLIIVIDGSRRLADARGAIASALQSLPTASRFSVIQAGEEVEELIPMRQAAPDALREAVGQVRRMRCVGWDR